MSAASRPGGYRLLADIGGTHARFALQRRGRQPGRFRMMETGAYPGLVPALKAYLGHWPGLRPEAAAFAVAAPLTGDRVRFTNAAWSFSRSALAGRTGIARVHVLNDFEALAWALPGLGGKDLAKIGRGRTQAGAPQAVFGPGTGLGVACFVPEAAGGPLVLATEGGHATLAAGTDREAAILAGLRRRFGHVSAERALSGPGLANLYGALAALDGGDRAKAPAPAAIARAARAGRDAVAVEACAMFSALLGQVAGDLALQFGARGGVHVAGGVIKGLGAAFDRRLFRRRFEAKGRYKDWLAAVPSYLITHPRPAMAGLARFLERNAGPAD
ncbi:MAG: glucokinase [Alphaproteobacteria bacterium]|nr:glucokinase [Alphaproteobacteria bacterium]